MTESGRVSAALGQNREWVAVHSTFKKKREKLLVLFIAQKWKEGACQISSVYHVAETVSFCFNKGVTSGVAPVTGTPLLQFVPVCNISSCRVPRWLRWRRICLQCCRHGFSPWVGRSNRKGNDSPLQYSGLENPVDRGAWWAKSVGLQGVDGTTNTEWWTSSCQSNTGKWWGPSSFPPLILWRWYWFL